MKTDNISRFIESELKKSNIISNDERLDNYFLLSLYNIMDICSDIINKNLKFKLNDEKYTGIVEKLIYENFEKKEVDWDFLVFGINDHSYIGVNVAGITNSDIFIVGNKSIENIYNGEFAVFKLLTATGIRKYAISQSGAKKILNMCNPLPRVSNRDEYKTKSNVINIITKNDLNSMMSFICLPPVVFL
ncbi:hypothetical protein GOB93_00285 [Acetobacter musti]|uniref:Uncharacterized protein n=1 Tax=Acetobacter musti TaxID=864732 RepID=A0ABX0JIB2_9PROT|nr:hypothetical protein [Acetobacter musti]NHN83087.1 hypothetical protein [Acetobacter musti]